MKQSQGFSLINIMIALVIAASAFVLAGKAYKTHRTNKDVVVIAEFVRVLNSIVQNDNSGALLYQVDPDSVSTNKNLPVRFSYDSTNQVFEDPNGTSVEVGLISSSMVSFFPQISNEAQGFMINVTFDNSPEGTARCSSLINTLINDFKIIGTATVIVRNVDNLRPIGSGCATRTPTAVFINY